ncbi:CheF family chemotaxis protein [Halorubrum ezzemoulense]|jgi:helix-turn-helix protein|uniref:Taxis protein CheF n=2 Tax=Halorubrum ezzemoulense TaxID=337243 RepID=A0A256JKI0_HALEZ|nr:MULTISPECIES: CheF family chemotaxis protein [Halorubrum]MDB2223144.1 CheF family chemotaxis protein [Halorubrum ezzemoulense]MDB2240517.1 CheF family chemotaxis protein [Halorubrum ezzemoulense]MDB2243605.1 CheF family chemotaxis protein [Halorubrum ezzemoulense]MDB2251671.1 CheF family chemotaxis protein [Halorubrum ezzemoulense]MDB2261912.1 CheF family chemotaxis protein [Halorubrum ezzemoulense]
MEESVVADFVGRVHAASLSADEPATGRVLLSQRRLVLATDDGKETIPLSRVFDVVVGSVPGDLRSFFNDSVTVAYERDGSRRSALVEGEPDDMDKFVRLLFTSLLRNVTVTVRHPAKVGGRVTDATDHRASVSVSPGEIRFNNCPDPFTVDLSSVIDYERTDRTLGGKKRPALVFEHVVDDQTVTSITTVPNERALNILGRYIKIEYDEAMEDLESFDPTEEQLEILVSIYSAGGEANIADVVTGDVAQTSMILDTLREEDLVADGDSGTTLTRKGQMIVSSYLESVNA